MFVSRLLLWYLLSFIWFASCFILVSESILRCYPPSRWAAFYSLLVFRFVLWQELSSMRDTLVFMLAIGLVLWHLLSLRWFDFSFSLVFWSLLRYKLSSRWATPFCVDFQAFVVAPSILWVDYHFFTSNFQVFIEVLSIF